MNTLGSYEIFPLGDSAITIQFGNSINESLNQKVFQLFHHLKKSNLTGVRDFIPAYSSLSIIYDPVALRDLFKGYDSVYEGMRHRLEEMLSQSFEQVETQSRIMRIPVCYGGEHGYDLDALATATNLKSAEVIAIHSNRTYKVFMMGFLPGFSYLSPIDERIKMPRKSQPQPVPAGSVGIAGIQTGIYPVQSPGGWQIIGRTPLKMFDKDNDPAILLQPGDTIEFFPITADEFQNY